LLAEQGDIGELRARADADDLDSAWRLARLLDEENRFDELYEEVLAGTDGAGEHFIDILRRCGETGLAEHLQNLGFDPDD
jgi:hypothetical protein